MKNNCDKCDGIIINGKCRCGFWYEKDEIPNFAKTFERAIYAYDYMCEQHLNESPFTGDHHSGNGQLIIYQSFYRKQKNRVVMNKFLCISITIIWFLYCWFGEYEYGWILRHMVSLHIGYMCAYTWKYNDLRDYLLSHKEVNK
jgi:hypothetical protein